MIGVADTMTGAVATIGTTAVIDAMTGVTTIGVGIEVVRIPT